MKAFHIAISIALIIFIIILISNVIFRQTVEKNGFLVERVLPVSGFEKAYFPIKWNIPPAIFTHNCYYYEFDNYNIFKTGFSQPGYLSHSKPSESGDRMTCAGVNERLNNDHGNNITVAGRNDVCGPGKYKIALIADRNKDYHFLRQNKDGTWSHKPGNTFATNLDYSGKLVTDPEAANFISGEFSYNDFCNYFCIDRDAKLNFRSKVRKWMSDLI